jgi:hypothetical protein
MTTAVHEAGVVLDGIQKCIRCRMIMAEPGLMPFPFMAHVRITLISGAKLFVITDEATTCLVTTPFAERTEA